MGGSMVKLPYSRVMEMLLTGELMDAHEAWRLGFVNRVVPKESVLETADYFAGLIVKKGPMATAAVKKAVLSNMGLTLSEGLAREMELCIPVFLNRDAQEGPRAFKEKREPRYQGK
jgi:enoyl-CoA hydratase